MAAPKLPGSNLTKQQEEFCHKFIETGNASEAYRQSYNCENSSNSTIWNHAWEVLHHADVEARIKELRTQQAELYNITAEIQAKKLEGIYINALADKEYAPAISAVMGQSKHYGLLVDKSELTGKNGGAIETKDVSDNEIARRIAFILMKAKKEKESIDDAK